MHCRLLELATTLASAGFLGACSDPGACLLYAAPAIAVEVRDASTDAYIAGLVHGVATDGDFVDSLRAIAGLGSDPAQVTTVGGAYEREGTYAIHLEAPDYQVWDTTGVRVTSDGCHVRTARLTARMQAAS